MSKAKCYGKFHELGKLLHYRKFDSHDSCGKEVLRKLGQIIKLLEKQEEIR